MKFLDLSFVNFVGPTIVAVMLVAALRREASFNWVKVLITALAAMAVDYGMTVATLLMKDNVGTTAAIWIYILVVTALVMVLIHFIMRIPWKYAAVMGVFYMVSSMVVQFVRSIAG